MFTKVKFIIQIENAQVFLKLYLFNRVTIKVQGRVSCLFLYEKKNLLRLFVKIRV